MPEYVYALHDFLPEHEDEVSFHAGERIEVIEKNDMYGDGWWHGRTLAGGVGLFPVCYTAPAPPATDTSHVLPPSEHVSDSPGIPTSNGKSVLQPLTEESESEASGINIPSPVPEHPTAPLLNSDHDTELPYEGGASHNLASGEGEIMEAKMTDVQKAIERDGVGEDGDCARSFSFASTRDGANTENSDFNLGDSDETEINGNDDHDHDWHKFARRKMAAKAKRAIEEAEKVETMMGDSGRRAITPPIEVNVSDANKVEDDTDLTRSSNFRRNHSNIPEENEDIGTDGKASAATNVTRYSTIDTLSTTDVVVPPKDETDFPSATKPSFSASQTPTESLPEEPEKKALTLEKDIYPSFISPLTTTLPNIQQILKRSSTPAREIPNGLSFAALAGHISSKRNSMTSSSSALGMLLNANNTSVFTRPASISVSTVQGRNETPPMMEWSVKEVVDWLKVKGFDQDVCDKFIEQEVTGDVLLELDVNLLKREIGIMAFGKRVRIANAITDLCRSPSIGYSDHQLLPTQPHHSNSLTRSRSESRTQSRSQSLPGTTPATTVGHVHWYGMRSSFGSPGVGYGRQSVHLQNSPVNMSAAARVGPGIAFFRKRPPSQLLLSPVLKEPAARTASAMVVNGEDGERGHMSDNEITLNSTSMHRRVFGLSHESAIMNSSSRSKGSPLSSLIVLDKDNNSVIGKDTTDKDTPIIGIRRTLSERTRRSVDPKASDRLSIIETTFGSTLGKTRKPPPSEDTLTEKASRFSLLRLHSPSTHRSSSTSSHGPSISNGSPHKGSSDFTGMYDEKEKEKSFTTLRERTSSNSNSNVTTSINANAPETVNGVSGAMKQGVNVVNQIGEPDHTGWLRMREDGSNSWKSRYFILKEPYLYFSRSNHKSGYIHIAGYNVTVDENVDPGRYGFRIDHDHDKTYYFSSEKKSVIHDWMKAVMKAVILRDYTKPVVSSCNIPTIPLVVAQAMEPAPRPPSPSTCEATQRALRRENTEQPSARDTLILGLNSNATIVEGDSNPSFPKACAPQRPSRRLERMSSVRSMTSQTDDSLIKWANTHLPRSLQITDSTGSLFSGLGLLRLAESIKGQPSSPPVPDSAFPDAIHGDKLDGLFMLFDFLLDNDVKIGRVSINDVRLGKRDKIIQLLKALKAWEDKLKALDLRISSRATSPAAFMLM